MPDPSGTVAKCRTGTAKNFTLLLLLYLTQANLPGYYKGPRTPLSVALSRDNGETFEIICTLEDQRGDYCYPSVICNDDNKIMITYTWKREKIVYVSFTLED